MKLSLTDDQRALQDAVGRYVARDYGFLRREERRRTTEGWDRAAWSQLAELGLVALGVPEDQGGLDGSPVDIMVVASSLGRALILEPWLPCAVMGVRCLRAAGGAAANVWLQRVAEGADIAVLALDEPQGSWPVCPVHTQATRDGAGFRLDGIKLLVPHAQAAQLIMVPARTSGSPGQREGISLFVANPQAPGVELRPYRTQDGLAVADVLLHGVQLGPDAVVGHLDGAWPALEEAAAYGIAAMAAEAQGVMELLLEQTVEHLKNRRQFGQALAQFQVLRHAAVDMLISLEQVRSMAWFAAAALEEPDAAARGRALSEVKAVVGRHARAAAQHAVQLHGAIGLTDDCVVSHAFRRLMAIELQLGNADQHLALLATGQERAA